MAPITRGQTARGIEDGKDSVGALQHLRCAVLGDDEEGGRLQSAFDSLTIDTITDFIILEKSDFEDAEVNTEPDSGTKLTRIEVKRLLKAQEWYMTHPDPNKSITTWFNLTSDDFDKFLLNGHSQTVKRSPTADIPVSRKPDSNPALDFARGIKRDVTQYKEFTDDQKYVLWNRHFKSLAAVHGIEDVLNKDYV